MKARILAALTLLVVVGMFGAGSPLAQLPEQISAVNVSFSETIDLIGATSSTYFKAFAERQQHGLLFLSPEEANQLRAQLKKIVYALKPFTGDTRLPSLSLSDENKAALSAALLCRNCSGKLSDDARPTYVETREALQRLLIARCKTIDSLLPSNSNSTPSQDTLLSLEVHFSYLRQIAIVYAGTE